MTPGKGTSRRDYLKLMAAGAGLGATSPTSWAQEAVKKTMTADPQAPPPDHDRRIQWWQASSANSNLPLRKNSQHGLSRRLVDGENLIRRDRLRAYGTS